MLPKVSYSFLIPVSWISCLIINEFLYFFFWALRYFQGAPIWLSVLGWIVMGVALECVLGNKRGHTVIRGVFGAGSGVRVDGALWESFSL